MTKKDIAELSDLKLLAGWYWVGSRVTNEVNSKRGLTKATAKQEAYYVTEICKRFGFAPDDFFKELNPL